MNSPSTATEILTPEGIARGVAALPAALFMGSVSGPLNVEATTLASELDPKLLRIRADIAATLELCHVGNDPTTGRLAEDVEEVRAKIRSIKAMAASLLNGTYVAPRAKERLHREATLSSFRRHVGGSGEAHEPDSPADQDLVLEL